MGRLRLKNSMYSRKFTSGEFVVLKWTTAYGCQDSSFFMVPNFSFFVTITQIHIEVCEEKISLKLSNILRNYISSLNVAPKNLKNISKHYWQRRITSPQKDFQCSPKAWVWFYRNGQSKMLPHCFPFPFPLLKPTSVVVIFSKNLWLFVTKFEYDTKLFSLQPVHGFFPSKRNCCLTHHYFILKFDHQSEKINFSIVVQWLKVLSTLIHLCKCHRGITMALRKIKQ